MVVRVSPACFRESQPLMEISCARYTHSTEHGRSNVEALHAAGTELSLSLPQIGAPICGPNIQIQHVNMNQSRYVQFSFHEPKPSRAKAATSSAPRSLLCTCRARHET